MRESREGTCSFEGCGRKILARRLCAGHYTQSRNGQELRPLKGRALPWQERLESYIVKGHPEECWSWSGGHTRAAREGQRYAVFTYRNKTVGAHRAVYEKYFGKPAPGMEIDHQCCNPSCVNPSHLKAVTRGENLQNKPAYSNSKTGVRGVSPHCEGGYVVHVSQAGKNVYGGRYDTVEEAERAAIALRNKLYTNNVQDRK